VVRSDMKGVGLGPPAEDRRPLAIGGHASSDRRGVDRQSSDATPGATARRQPRSGGRRSHRGHARSARGCSHARRNQSSLNSQPAVKATWRQEPVFASCQIREAHLRLRDAPRSDRGLPSPMIFPLGCGAARPSPLAIARVTGRLGWTPATYTFGYLHFTGGQVCNPASPFSLHPTIRPGNVAVGPSRRGGNGLGVAWHSRRPAADHARDGSQGPSDAAWTELGLEG
jgi:hypothetical protein